MTVNDSLLTDVEIQYLDFIISEISRMENLRSLYDFTLLWDDLKAEDTNGVLEYLRIKGIINQKKTIKTRVITEYETEHIVEEEVLFGTIDPKQLIISWLVTVYNRSGKNLTETYLRQLENKANYFTFPIEVGEDKVNINLIVKDLDESEYVSKQENSIYVSFIGNLPLKTDSYIHWFYPFTEMSAAFRFFTWINEQSKPVLSKIYSFINIPSDLEKADREQLFVLLKMYIENLDYQRVNKPEFFRPESLEYLFAESEIKDCFINNKENKKLFIILKNDRIEIHSFSEGIKSSDMEISYHLEKLQEWIDMKANSNRKILHKIKASLGKDLLKMIPIIITIILSAFASSKLLFSQNQTLNNLPQTKMWLAIHVGLSIISIAVLFFIGIYPQVQHWFFSWSRGLKKYTKNNINNYKSNRSKLN
ncbi:hypothetical protein [Neobacillus sp. SuZ13]|uniref:hypothetical protein n=1 Tax=Neobacillus sp. SuZ13 TaxID=3047875 RepID=UPI0024BF27FA|nr:hypothetical protein [Neobacillus sp. SuZ13]WHY65365.1 hypothetical protein QNH17_20035 [Neobacillus sp. SuZ13]